MTESALDAILEAWMNPDSVCLPEWHSNIKLEVHMMMPALARALDRAYLENKSQDPEEQSQSDEVDPGRTPAEGSETEADSSQDQEQKIQGDSHTSVGTQIRLCSHGIDWANMTFSHWAIEHKIDHP